LRKRVVESAVRVAVEALGAQPHEALAHVPARGHLWCGAGATVVCVCVVCVVCARGRQGMACEELSGCQRAQC
jgi:hypothetical protein